MVARPNRTAVLIVDMQRAFCAPRGVLARRGRPLAGAAALLPSVNGLIRHARRRGMMILFTRLVIDPRGTPGALASKMRREDGRDRRFARRAPDSALLRTLARRPEDRIIEKSGYDAFHGTALESTLRDAGVSRLVVAGVLTHVCVESSVRSAFERGFEVLVVEDATASDSEEARRHALANVRRSFGRVITLRAFRAAPPRRPPGAPRRR